MLQLGDAVYSMQKHGFAGKSNFAAVGASDGQALFRLTESTETLPQYPFAFELEAYFRLAEATLHKTVAVRNTIAPDAISPPVIGNELALSDALFDDDALVWRDLNSRSLAYGAPDHPYLDIAFPDTARLGIWTKQKAAFVCVEPWPGIADPEGYQGDFHDKPGVMKSPPAMSARSGRTSRSPPKRRFRSGTRP